MDTQVNRAVEDPRSFGKIHPQKKDVAPGAVREVHPHRSFLAEDRKTRRIGARSEQFGPNSQGMIGDVPCPKHPLVAAYHAYAAPDLVGQGLKREPMVSVGQSAGQTVARAL